MPVFAGFAAVPQSNSVWVCNAGAVCIVPGFWTGDEVITVHTIDGKWDTVPVSSTLTVKEVLLELHCAHYAAGAALPAAAANLTTPFFTVALHMRLLLAACTPTVKELLFTPFCCQSCACCCCC